MKSFYVGTKINMGQRTGLAGVAQLLCLLLLFANSASRLAAQAESDEQSDAPVKVVAEAEVRPLLLQLEAATLSERDAAERGLIALGGSVLPFLPKVDDDTSGEMKIRLQRIRQSLDEVDLEAFFEASKITLEGSMTVSEAIEEIMDQTDNVIVLQGDDAAGDIEIVLSATEQPFWDVMGFIIAEAGLRINAFGTTENELVLAPGGGVSSDAPPVFSEGPFRVEASFAQATRQFSSRLPGQLQVSMLVTWEPRLEPVFLQIPMASVEAKVGEDVVINATNPQAAPEIPLNYGSTTQVDLQLALPERSVPMLDKLSGEFVIAVPGERHKFEFTKFGNGARQTEKFGDVAVILEGARRNGKVYEMRVKVQFGDGQGTIDSFRGWVLSNQAYLLDAGGNRVENLGLNTYGMSSNSVGIAYLFQINDDPNKFTLVYESPSSITKQRVRYELKDIALP